LNVNPRRSERVAEGDIPNSGVPEIADEISDDAKLSQQDADKFLWLWLAPEWVKDKSAWPVSPS